MFRRAAIAFPLALVSGCTTYDGHREVVPFFEVFQDPEDLPPPSLSPVEPSGPEEPPRHEESLFPWLDGAGSARDAEASETTGSPPPRPAGPREMTERVLRPLGSFADDGKDHRRLRVLWPILEFERDSGEVRQRIIPFWYRQLRRDERGGSNDRWVLFPFLFGGHVSAKGDYFAFFPFAGKLRGILAKDEIDFILGPVYWRSRWELYTSLHILFPFYNRVWGGGTSGWRIWPFYGHYRSETEDGRPRYDRTFVLWPFWFHHRDELNTRHPSEMVFVFPFWGKKESDIRLTRTILWPFFNTTIDKRTGQKVHFGFLIPYRIAEGQLDLWPLFGIKRYAVPEGLSGSGLRRRYRHFLLVPIERYDEEEDSRWRSTRFWFLPFYWRYHEVRKTDGAEDLEWNLWPLARYRRLPGRTTFHFPSPIPIRQEVPFERLYARLWRLFLYEATPEREGWEFLYSLLSYRNEKVSETGTFRILGGLFERESGPAGARYRFFYLPWRSRG